jgi:hypothetical protein
VEVVARLRGPGLAGPLQYLRLDEPVKQVLRLHKAAVEQRPGDPGREVRRLEQSEQAERAALTVLEVPVAQLEAGPDLQVAKPELGEQVVVVGQAVGERPQLRVPPGGQLAPAIRTGQGQVPAQRDDPPGLLGLGVDPLLAGDPGQELDPLIEPEDVEVVGVDSREPGERGPAGDRTAQPGLPGNRGRTWASSAALSSTTRTR